MRITSAGRRLVALGLVLTLTAAACGSDSSLGELLAESTGDATAETSSTTSSTTTAAPVSTSEAPAEADEPATDEPATDDPATADTLTPDTAPPGTAPELDTLWVACAAGDPDACDDLWITSPVDSIYETFGFTCGARELVDAVVCSDIMGDGPTEAELEAVYAEAGGTGILTIAGIDYPFDITMCFLEPRVSEFDATTILEFEIRGEAFIEDRVVIVNGIRSVPAALPPSDSIGYGYADDPDDFNTAVSVSPEPGSGLFLTVEGTTVSGGPVPLNRVLGIAFADAEYIGDGSFIAIC